MCLLLQHLPQMLGDKVEVYNWQLAISNTLSSPKGQPLGHVHQSLQYQHGRSLVA